MQGQLPLAGLRVLDLASFIAGPVAATVMGDYGAEVIKIESPTGDHIRSRPPRRQGRSTYFAQLNCGKKSLALDLKKPQAIALIKQLVSTADVVVENFRPDVKRRLQIDYDRLQALNPRLVYLTLGAFGNLVRVEGHTDDMPIHNIRFSSNWELSTARASAVVALFIAQRIDPRPGIRRWLALAGLRTGLFLAIAAVAPSIAVKVVAILCGLSIPTFAPPQMATLYGYADPVVAAGSRYGWFFGAAGLVLAVAVTYWLA